MSLSFYYEHVNELKKPELKEFETLTLQGPMSLNGYVVIPNSLPIDYFDGIHTEIDDGPVGGLTFGGYITDCNGAYVLLYLDETPSLLRNKDEYNDKEFDAAAGALQKKSVRVIGFDDNHIFPNAMSAKDGAEYIATQLKELCGDK